MREQLLSHLPWFVSAVTKLPGIRRVALLGSITTNKQNPKDIDFLVVVDNDIDLEPLARLGRRIKGTYLHDDLKTVSLSDERVRGALELWPSLEGRVSLPDDLKKILNRLEV